MPTCRALAVRCTTAVLLMILPGCSRQEPRPAYDLLITGGSVIDGNGTPAVAADVGVRNGVIAAIGDLATASATRRIDASGLTVAPGFIDIHNHSDYTILSEPRAESMIRQGVTTMVFGESRSAGPRKPGVNEDPRAGSDRVAPDWTTLGGYFERLERQRMATNVASYVGHEQVWTHVKGYGQSAATRDELDEMKTLVAQAMEQGAMGLSTALLQPPSSVATTANLIELAAVARAHGGIYSTHIRDEGEGVFMAIAEAIAVGKGAGVRGGHHPHEDRAPQPVGAREGDHRDRSAGARRRPRRPGQRLPLHRRAEQPVVDRAPLGARRRARADARAPGRPGGAPADATRGAGGAARLVQPLPGDRRRLGRDAAGVAAAPAQQAVPGAADERADCRPRRQSRGRAVRRAARGEGQRADGVLPSFRGRHAGGDAAALDLDRIGRQRGEPRWTVGSVTSASPLLRHVSRGCSGATSAS